MYYSQRDERPPVRRRIYRCAFFGETENGRYEGPINAMDGRVSVRDAEIDEARDTAEKLEGRAG